MKKQNILFIGYDKKYEKKIKTLLKKEPFEVFFTKADLKDFGNLFDNQVFDLVVLNYEEKTAMDVCHGIFHREKMSQIPLVFYASKKVEDNEIAASLLSCADDFIFTTLSDSIFVAKIKATLRRQERNRKATKKIKIGKLLINPKKRKVSKKDEIIDLTKIEYDILLLLARDKGKIFSRQEIYKHIWGSSVIVGERTLDVHINNLRKKIGKNNIKTKKGVGFMIAAKL